MALAKLNASVTPNSIQIEKVELHEEDKTRELVLFPWALIYSFWGDPETRPWGTPQSLLIHPQLGLGLGDSA